MLKSLYAWSHHSNKETCVLTWDFWVQLHVKQAVLSLNFDHRQVAVNRSKNSWTLKSVSSSPEATNHIKKENSEGTTKSTKQPNTNCVTPKLRTPPQKSYTHPHRHSLGISRCSCQSLSCMQTIFACFIAFRSDPYIYNYIYMVLAATLQSTTVPSSGGNRPWANDCSCEALNICWAVRWGLSPPSSAGGPRLSTTSVSSLQMPSVGKSRWLWFFSNSRMC